MAQASSALPKAVHIADSVSTNRRDAGSCGASRSSILVVDPFHFSAVSNVTNVRRGDRGAGGSPILGFTRRRQRVSCHVYLVVGEESLPVSGASQPRIPRRKLTR